MQIAIVLYPGFTALDAVGPYEVLRTIPGAEIRFVSRRPTPVTADSGALILAATHSFEETPRPDIVLVPGSSADTATAMADGQLLDWLGSVHPTTRLTVSVCTGALVLAAAGLLKGCPATTHWMAQDALKVLGADPRVNERIVRSGKIMTAAGVSAGLDLALGVVEEICGRTQAEVTQLMIEYDPQPPVQSGHPSMATEEVLAEATATMRRQSRNRRNLVSIPTILWRTAIETARIHFSARG